MSETPDLDAYSLRTGAVAEIDAPVLPYRPPLPSRYRPRIALVGAGGISAAHLAAYASAGFDVAVICNRTLAKAEARRDEYFPDAEATDDIARTLARDDIAVVDLTPHPAERFGMIETALRAGKHVLSQKPFVLDLDAGARLCDLADERGVVLAVNQNGRWAPHLAWMREAVAAGLVGDVQSATVAINWNHGWIAGTPFEAIDDLILYDFAVHWFDFVASVLPRPAMSVFAVKGRAAGQSVRPPMLANAIVSFDDAQASLGFDGAAFLVPDGNPRGIGTFQGVVRAGVRLAVLDGSSELTYARSAGVAEENLLLSDSQSSLFRDVVGGRAQAGALTAISLADELRRNPGSGVEITDPVAPTVDGRTVVPAAAFATRTGETDLLTAFDVELAALQDSGEWLTLTEPFGMDAGNLPDRDLTTAQLCSPA